MTEADDPYGGRSPTSHEQRAGAPWDASYRDGPAPWDTGRPQPAIVRLADEGAFAGAVLDAGCGTGDNALHLAALGLRGVGVDVAETALAIARDKAAARGLDAEFAACDALHLDRLSRAFDTVLDCGLFHIFTGADRTAYVDSLHVGLRPGGRYFMLAFSDREPGPWPHKLRRDDITAAFADGWRLESIEPATVQARTEPAGVRAWLTALTRH
jgi:ubiquinone/menaquinone biosynthesis C-methylase UbiE